MTCYIINSSWLVGEPHKMGSKSQKQQVIITALTISFCPWSFSAGPAEWPVSKWLLYEKRMIYPALGDES